MEIIEFAPEGPRELLWREAVGHELRRIRLHQDRTQSDVAAEAGISTQYLSEIERGRKEPSSEILEAVLSALGLRLVDMTERVTLTLRSIPLTVTSILSAGQPTGPTSSIGVSVGSYDSMLLAA